MAVRFLVPDSNAESARHFACAHWLGKDRFVGVASGHFADGVYTVDNVPRCGRHLQLPWRIDGLGDFYVRAPQLMEREEPYRLTTELARGQLAQAYEYIASLRLSKDELPPELQERMKLACDSLLQSARLDGQDGAERFARESLKHAVLLGDQIARSQCPSWSPHCRLGVVLNDARWSDVSLEPFQHVTIPICWKQLEPAQDRYCWEGLDEQIDRCLESGLPFTVGPLVDFHRDCLPDWLSNWDDDADLVVSLMCNFVETVIHRYESKVRSWETSSGVNADDLFMIGEELTGQLFSQFLRIACDLAPTARRIFTVDQPWSEYLLHGHRQCPTYCLVDSMLRCGPPVSALNIEVAMGYPPWGGQRTLLDFSKMLDRYSELGVPLQVRLYFPSSPPPDCTPGAAECTQKGQADWLESHVLVAASKDYVEQVTCGTLLDNEWVRWPFSGLLTAQGEPKLSYARMANLTSQYAQSSHGIGR